MNQNTSSQALYKETAGWRTTALELKTQLLESIPSHHPRNLLKKISLNFLPELYGAATPKHLEITLPVIK